MLFLIGSIILTSYLTLSFKAVERFGIPVFQAIVFNYIVCVITGSVVNGGFPINASTFSAPWFKWAVIMGTLFVSIFNIIGLTTQKLGVAVASVANKLSLVIPFVFSIYLYNETATWMRVAGIIMALVAVFLTCMPKRNQKNDVEKKRGLLVVLLPAVLFLGSGFLDTLVKYVEDTFLNEANSNAYLITAFGVAASVGSLVLAGGVALGKMKFDPRSMVAGILIGIPNYFSIWCLVRVLKDYQGASSAIIPINNMGIVLFSAVMAMILFRERLSPVNWAGIFLSLCAIALIAFG